MKHVSEPLASVLIHIAKQSESNRARIIALIEDLKRKLADRSSPRDCR